MHALDEAEVSNISRRAGDLALLTLHDPPGDWPCLNGSGVADARSQPWHLRRPVGKSVAYVGRLHAGLLCLKQHEIT
jgi:hypothetical protein